jgi:hypothetical protein
MRIEGRATRPSARHNTSRCGASDFDVAAKGKPVRHRVGDHCGTAISEPTHNDSWQPHRFPDAETLAAVNRVRGNAGSGPSDIGTSALLGCPLLHEFIAKKLDLYDKRAQQLLSIQLPRRSVRPGRMTFSRLST